MYEKRKTGACVAICDVEGCEHEMIAPSDEDLLEDLNLAGWRIEGDAPESSKFVCDACSSGTSPAETMWRAAGLPAELKMKTDHPVKAGEAIVDDDGTEVAVSLEDGKIGDIIRIKVKFPEPKLPDSVSAQYADLLDGDDNGPQSAVAKPPEVVRDRLIQQAEDVFSSISETTWCPDE